MTLTTTGRKSLLRRGHRHRRQAHRVHDQRQTNLFTDETRSGLIFSHLLKTINYLNNIYFQIRIYIKPNEIFKKIAALALLPYESGSGGREGAISGNHSAIIELKMNVSCLRIKVNKNMRLSQLFYLDWVEKNSTMNCKCKNNLY